MDTTDEIVATEAEYSALLSDPRRPFSRFIDVSLNYGRMLANLEPHRSAEVLAVALETLHDPPAAAEIGIAVELIAALRPVAAEIRWFDAELDAISRQRSLVDSAMLAAEPGERVELCRRAAAIRFDDGQVATGFCELMEGLRGCDGDGLDELATDLVVAVRRHHVPAEMISELESMWVELRRERTEGMWPLWCLTALGALRLDAGDVITSQMYVRRAETSLGHLQRPVACALVGGWVALATEDFERAHDRMSYAASASRTDERTRLLAVAGLGEALLCLGRFNEARSPLAEAISYDIGDPGSVARCHELLAELAAHDGRPSDAYDHLKLTRRFEQLARGAEPPSPVMSAVADPLPGDIESEVAAKLNSEIENDQNPARQTPSRQTRHTETTSPSMRASAHLQQSEQTIDLRRMERDANVADANRQVREFVDGGQLRLAFELVYNNENGRAGAGRTVVCVENGYGDLVSVADLIALCSDVDIAEQICEWTLRQAVSTLVECHQLGHALVVGVDIAESQVTPRLPALVSEVLSASGVPSDLLMLELTADAVSSLSAEQRAVLGHLRTLDVRFGMNHLHHRDHHRDLLALLPVDVVSFENSQLATSSPGVSPRTFVRQLLDEGSQLGFQVIAAGISTPDELNWQRAAGCHGACGPVLGELVLASRFSRSLSNVA